MAYIKEQGKGYKISVYVGKDYNGKKVYKSTTFIPADGLKPRQRKQQAEAAAVEFESKIKSGVVIDDNIYFCDLMTKWYEQIELENKLHKTTIDRYHDCDGKIIEYFKVKKVKDIRIRDVQEFINEIAKHGKKHTTEKGKTEKLPTSTKTQKAYLTVLSNVFEYGIRYEYCTDNPTKGVRATTVAPNKRDAYTEDEVKKIVATLNNKAPLEMKVFFFLVIFSGCRYGEILGVNWNDIDFAKEELHITRTASSVKGKGTVIGPTKTRNSTRTIKLSPKIVELVKEYHKEWCKNAALIPDISANAEGVFINFANGCKYWGTNYARNWFRKFTLDNNLPYKSVHSFRHSFATILIASGEDIKTVSDNLGHADVSITLNTYAHALEERKAQAFKNYASRYLDDEN